MQYPYPSEETIEAIKNLFYDRSNFTFSLEAREDGYYITVSQMYGYVEFEDISVLQGYMKIAQLLNCKDGDEADKYGYGGCDTCDYGSKYTVDLKFW